MAERVEVAGVDVRAEARRELEALEEAARRGEALGDELRSGQLAVRQLIEHMAAARAREETSAGAEVRGLRLELQEATLAKEAIERAMASSANARRDAAPARKADWSG